ncbi:MAG: hypothetical protein M1838_000288 [Thelocarpon superellum]|nr:MAG: hypothetical protein M1838_000288 [Thelocarpon superellum]
MPVFPSSYRSDAESSTTKVEVEGQTDLPARTSRVGREDRYSSISATLPRRRQERVEEEDVNVYEGEDRRRRDPSRRQEVIIEEERHRHHRSPRVEERREEVIIEEDRHRHHRSPRFEARREEVTVIDEDERRHHHHRPHHRHHHHDREHYHETDLKFEGDELDVTERDYRHRTHPRFAEYAEEFERDYSTEPRRTTDFEIREEVTSTVDPPRRERDSMGYYDEDGEYHSFRHGVHKAADRLLHPHHPRSTVREEIHVTEEERYPRDHHRSAREEIVVSDRRHSTNTITIPCHHIRIGDLVMLQGHPCQVIRITTSAQTGQYRYLGVDLFSKQLHEESSFISNPSPSVIVQNMLGPVFKQYRVLDIRDDGRVVAMTETGDVKQGLPVIDQGGLWSRLNDAFAHGRGSVRVMVIHDRGRELAVDYKVVHGSRL